MKRNKIYCYDPKKQKNILAGEYDPQIYTFVKKAKKNHFMILEHSYGIQEEVLQQLNKLGCYEIHIQTKTGVIISLLDDWLKRPIKNYGHGNQRFLGKIKI
jgi:hypothetical protein